MLNLAASEWFDENGQTWLQAAPKIKLLSEKDKREPYPLSWEEQHRLFKELPKHLHEMALFAINTGCRDREVCILKWEWELPMPEINGSVFIIPGSVRKNGHGHPVVLNRIARSVIEGRHNQHPEYVFSFRNKPISRINNSAWQNACKRANLIMSVCIIYGTHTDDA